MELNDFLPDRSAPLNTAVVNGMIVHGDFHLITADDIRAIFRSRDLFSHKGTYGHALIIAGAPATMGAALLSAEGCLHAGAGLTTAAIPETGLMALNTLLPEVMYIARADLKAEALEKYNAIAAGPGMTLSSGISKTDLELMQTLTALKQPLVLDAEGLNFLAANKRLLQSLPGNSVLTPHVKEFDRLFGKHATWWERLLTAREMARELKIVIVLKNQYTLIAVPEDGVFINPTGNPAMAQGGMGDVLTGIIAAYIAQGYEPAQASVLGCYFHGRAGDELAGKRFNVSASRVAARLPKTVRKFLDK